MHSWNLRQYLLSSRCSPPDVVHTESEHGWWSSSSYLYLVTIEPETITLECPGSNFFVGYSCKEFGLQTNKRRKYVKGSYWEAFLTLSDVGTGNTRMPAGRSTLLCDIFTIRFSRLATWKMQWRLRKVPYYRGRRRQFENQSTATMVAWMRVCQKGKLGSKENGEVGKNRSDSCSGESVSWDWWLYVFKTGSGPWLSFLDVVAENFHDVQTMVPSHVFPCITPDMWMAWEL